MEVASANVSSKCKDIHWFILHYIPKASKYGALVKQAAGYVRSFTANQIILYVFWCPSPPLASLSHSLTYNLSQRHALWISCPCILDRALPITFTRFLYHLEISNRNTLRLDIDFNSWEVLRNVRQSRGILVVQIGRLYLATIHYHTKFKQLELFVEEQSVGCGIRLRNVLFQCIA